LATIYELVQDLNPLPYEDHSLKTIPCERQETEKPYIYPIQWKVPVFFVGVEITKSVCFNE
jgi:hypothetical protein